MTLETFTNDKLIVQGTHRLIQWLEKSKENTEILIDKLSLGFFIIDKNSIILRANAIAAELFASQPEQTFGKSLKSLLNVASRGEFQKQILASESKPISFDMVLRINGKERLYHWMISSFKAENETLYSVFLTDVTVQRMNEQKITSIFSAIPIGIIQVNQDLEIVAPYSSSTETILGKSHLDGKEIMKVLFEPGWGSLKQSEREGIENLFNTIAYPAVQFDLLKETLPTSIKYALPSAVNEIQKRTLGLSFQPLIKNGKIDGFIILIDDRTRLEQISKKAEEKQISDDLIVKRFLEVRNFDTNLLPKIMEDLQSFKEDLEDRTKHTEVTPILRCLHGIKGTARIGGFSHLSKIAHELEDAFLSNPELKVHQVSFTALHNEIDELTKISRVMATDEQSQQSATDVLKQKLQLALLETAKTSARKVNLIFDFKKSDFPEHLSHDLFECLLHLITNAMDHGIEPPDERLRLGKQESGEIRISSYFKNENHIIEISDDGCGIDPEKVAESAMRKGIITQESLSSMSPDDKIMLIFKPGFSTRDTASMLSGRGIGLDSVKTIIEKNKGKVTVHTKPGAGSKFILSVPKG